MSATAADDGIGEARQERSAEDESEGGRSAA